LLGALDFIEEIGVNLDEEAVKLIVEARDQVKREIHLLEERKQERKQERDEETEDDTDWTHIDSDAEEGGEGGR
jgi:hypothetical protein